MPVELQRGGGGDAKGQGICFNNSRRLKPPQSISSGADLLYMGSAEELRDWYESLSLQQL
eukprot:120921-Rhodomonas_salina.1